MNSFDRRNFLFLSSGAAAGHILVSGMEEGALAQAENSPPSALTSGKSKPLRHAAIPGFLSAAQIAPHHTAHYGGALRAYLSLDSQLESSLKAGPAITGEAFGAMQRTRVSRGNSVLLHELYFDGMAPKIPEPPEAVRAAIVKRFGSLDKWASDFVACAKAAAGWALLVRHPVNGKLYHVVSDEHAMGPLWMATPLVIIDVYEHAYYIDYQNRKDEYVGKFLDYIDWAEVNRRYLAVASS